MNNREGPPATQSKEVSNKTVGSQEEEQRQ